MTQKPDKPCRFNIHLNCQHPHPLKGKRAADERKEKKEGRKEQRTPKINEICEGT